MKKVFIFTLLFVSLSICTACKLKKEINREKANSSEILLEFLQGEQHEIYIKLLDANVPIKEKKDILTSRVKLGQDNASTLIFLLAMQEKFGQEVKKFAIETYSEQLKNNGYNTFNKFLLTWIQYSLLIEQNSKSELAFSPQYTIVLNIIDPKMQLDKKRIEIEQLIKLDPVFARLILFTLSCDGVAFATEILKKDLFPSEDPETITETKILQAAIKNNYIFNYILTNPDEFIEALNNDAVYAFAAYAMQMDPLGFNKIRQKFLVKFQDKIYRAVIQDILVDVRIDTNTPVKTMQTLFKPIHSKLTKSDIVEFSNWTVSGVTRLLYGICASTDDQEIVKTILSSLVTKHNYLTREEGAVIDWVRENKSVIPKDGAQNFCKLALSHFYNVEELGNIIDSIDSFKGSRRLLIELVNSNNPTLNNILLKRYYFALDNNTLIRFLSHDDKEIRILAVKGLDISNDFMVKRAIMNAFAKEQDPEVLKVYRESRCVQEMRQ